MWRKPSQLSQIRLNSQSRRNKVQVQLLKDVPPFGVKGQLVKVRPSVMINTLHHQNRACYINKELGLNPKIPIVRKAAAPKVAKVKKTTPEAKKPSSVLEGLLFKTGSSADSSSSKLNEYRLIEALKQVPARVFFKNETDKDGKLLQPITLKVLNNYVYKMIGEKIPPQQISLKYVAPNGLFVPVEELDFVGNYVITFTVPSYNAVNREVRVVSTNLGQEAQQKLVRS